MAVNDVSNALSPLYPNNNQYSGGASARDVSLFDGVVNQSGGEIIGLGGRGSNSLQDNDYVSQVLNQFRNLSDTQAKEKVDEGIKQSNLAHKQALSQMVMLSQAKRMEQAVTSLIKLVSMVHELIEKAGNSIR